MRNADIDKKMKKKWNFNINNAKTNIAGLSGRLNGIKKKQVFLKKNYWRLAGKKE